MQTAALLAPAVVSAVDAGHVAAVAHTLQLLFNARQQPLLMWLLVAVTTGLERPDAAAAVAWEAMHHSGGSGKEVTEPPACRLPLASSGCFQLHAALQLVSARLIRSPS